MKTLFIIILFILTLILIAFSFSLFFQPEDKLRYDECVLLQNLETNAVDCYGCVDEKCKDAPTDWIIFDRPEVSTPYACFEGDNGCELAQ
jgi:hypothetical protein